MVIKNVCSVLKIFGELFFFLFGGRFAANLPARGSNLIATCQSSLNVTRCITIAELTDLPTVEVFGSVTINRFRSARPIIPLSSKILIASRNVDRVTPNCSASSISVGSNSPACNSPDRMACLISSLTTRYAGGRTSFGKLWFTNIGVLFKCRRRPVAHLCNRQYVNIDLIVYF